MHPKLMPLSPAAVEVKTFPWYFAEPTTAAEPLTQHNDAVMFLQELQVIAKGAGSVRFIAVIRTRG